MEEQLKCNLMLSLKEMLLRRVAVLLQNDMKILISLNSGDRVRWMNTHEEKVKDKISKLLLPESLRKEMIYKVRPISFEIRKWTALHHENIILNREIGFEKLYWTSAGTIDYKKTAKALLGCEELDAESRYKVASLYCLEDYIPLLWEELGEDRKKHFDNGYYRFCRIGIIPHLTNYWPRILKGEFSDLDCLWKSSGRNLTSFNQWAFEETASDLNKTAADYFFLKLTHEEREVSVMRATLDLLSESGSKFYFDLHSDFSCYLLSLMTPEQQIEAAKEHPVCVLWCFFLMSWQDLLVENAGLIWSFLPTSDYRNLSEEILRSVEVDCYHPKSFREFFIMSPLEFKKYLVHHESEWILGRFANPAYHFLDAFISKEDSDSIESIFGNLDVADRVAIVFNPDVLALFCRRKEDGRCMVKVCLREAKLSKEDRERLKNECPSLRRVIDELDESHSTADKEKKGRKRKLEECCKE